MLEYDDNERETDSEIRNALDGYRFPQRYVIALLVCAGTMNMYILRSGLTIAIVDMMSNKTLTVGNETITRDAEFHWDSKTRGFLLSVFYYGFLASPLGGYLAAKYEGARVFGYGMLAITILTFLAPFMLRTNFYWFVANRIALGVAEDVSFPSMQDIAVKWARPEERSKFVAFGFTGIYIGTAVSFPLCGYLAHKFNWAMVFYGTGLLSALWTLIWFLLVPSRSDDDDSRFSSYLSMNSTSSTYNRKITYPWADILSCRALWMLSVARISYGIGYNIVALCFPIYLTDVTSYNINDIGILSAIPNISTIFAIPLLGYLIDYVINKKICSVTLVHKVYLSGSLSVAAAILIGIGFMSKLTMIVLSLVCFKVFISFAMIVIQIMPICIAPAYCSLISGIVTLWHTITMIVLPLYMGFLITHHTIEQWRIYFLSTAIVMIIGAIIFSTYATSEVQPWATVPENEDQHEMESFEE